MHLKKNVFGNTIRFLLETLAKIKDLVAMKIREVFTLWIKGMEDMNFPQLATT
jgi:hypothetical protein